MKETVEIDALVIGGGIIGILTALEHNKSFPDQMIALVDKAKFLGDHTTGRNSGVLHAGIYYDTDSLKHRLCLKGNELWNEIANRLGIPLKRTGKFIIACSEDEKKLLDYTKEKALKNSVSGIRDITNTELEMLQEKTHAIAGIFSENTGILDASEAITKLADELFKQDIPLLKETEVLSITKNEESFIVETNNEIIETKILYNCAGLGSIAVRKLLGLNDLSNYFVKGNYVTNNKKMSFSSLIYPVPLKNLKGLGVHLTIDFQGKEKFGPDTEDVNSVSYKIEDERKNVMIKSINKIFKDVEKSDLEVDYCGIRPKILHEGKLHKDFWIKGPKDHYIENYFEACGIESPGLTSAPAIAKQMVSLINESITHEI